MLGLLTWTTHGTWLAGPARGRVDAAAAGLPEPSPDPDPRRGTVHRPVVRLDRRRQTLILEDLERVATLRGFRVHAAVVAPEHVHVLLGCASDRDLSRLVQLIKGALSRRLSVDGDDAPPHTTAGRPLRHHRWWSRQHALTCIGDDRSLRTVLVRLLASGGDDRTMHLSRALRLHPASEVRLADLEPTGGRPGP